MSASDHHSPRRAAPSGRAATRSSRRAPAPAPARDERGIAVRIAARLGELSLFGLFVVLPVLMLSGLAFAGVVYLMYG